jgi:hypothetical protein
MKAAFKTLLGLGIICAVVFVARAEDEKKAESKTFKGEIACPKCNPSFKKLVEKEAVPTKCANAIKVKEGDKEVVYILKDKGNKEPYHVCAPTKTKKATVTGVVSKKGKQGFITPDKDGVKVED